MSGTEGPIHGSQHAATLVNRLSNDLGLWQTQTEAALFLAALAAAHDTNPVPRAELGETQRIGHTDDVDGIQDGFAVLGLLHENGQDPASIRTDRLPGWIESGAQRVGPRIAGTSPHQAAREIVKLIEDLVQAQGEAETSA